jgi:hypothetical protein
MSGGKMGWSELAGREHVAATDFRRSRIAHWYGVLRNSLCLGLADWQMVDALTRVWYISILFRGMQKRSPSGDYPINERSHAKARRRKDFLGKSFAPVRESPSPWPSPGGRGNGRSLTLALSKEGIVSFVRTPRSERKNSVSYQVGTYPNDMAAGATGSEDGEDFGSLAFIEDGRMGTGVRGVGWLGHRGSLIYTYVHIA